MVYELANVKVVKRHTVGEWLDAIVPS